MAKNRAELVAKRLQLSDRMNAIAEMPAAEMTPEVTKEFDDAETEIKGLDKEIDKLDRAFQASAAKAMPVGGGAQPAATVPARAKEKDYPVGRYVKSLYAGGGSVHQAADHAKRTYGDDDVVTKALSTAVAADGGALVPEDFADQVIELLRPATVVRSSGALTVPMPRGTMRMPRQTSGVTGSYGSEGGSLSAEQAQFGDIVATFKKLRVLTPISNDLLRYASPQTDRIVQQDIVLGLARTEDFAFLRGDGTQDYPVGLKTIATRAGNTVPSNGTPTLDTVSAELNNAVLKLSQANIPMLEPAWFFHPRTELFLKNLKNANGFYVYKDEMSENKTLLGYAFKNTTAIPANLGVGGDESEIYFSDMAQIMIFDSLALSLAMSTDATYTAADGSQRNAFERDETLMRGIAEHDFHARHDTAVALITAVKWKF
ncbi:MAG TPA: phage major capsid protein [Dongiaceae bacterium]|nr:phage major capsid protein [Dongiaceae bacterium]